MLDNVNDNVGVKQVFEHGEWLKRLAFALFLAGAFGQKIVANFRAVDEKAIPNRIGGGDDALHTHCPHFDFFDVSGVTQVGRQAHGLATVVGEEG